MSLRTSSDLRIAEDGYASHVLYRRMLLYQALIQFLGPPNNSYQNLIILSFPLQTDLNSKRAVSSKDGQRWAKAHDLRSVNNFC